MIVKSSSTATSAIPRAKSMGRARRLNSALPTTPDKQSTQYSDTANTPSPCIHFRGEPLNTPARQQKRFPLIPAAVVAEDDSGPEKPKIPGKRNSFQRAVDVNKVTLENTKRNAGYRRCEIVKEVVRVDGPRPPSPSSNFLKSNTNKKRKQNDMKRVAEWDPIESPFKTTRSGLIRFTPDLNRPEEPKEPPFYDIQFPLRPVLKRPHGHGDDSSNPIAPTGVDVKEPVLVKRIVYADDEFAPIPDIIQPTVPIVQDDPPQKRRQNGTLEKENSKRNVKGPARRITR